jgi:ribonuclease HI
MVILSEVNIWTDGACQFNPGPGGWAALLQHPATGKQKQISGHENPTTNNRMELTAAVAALGALKVPCKVTLYSDSCYLVSGITKWLKHWYYKRINPTTQEESIHWKPIKNPDLWEEIRRLLEMHQVNAIHVRAHSGIEQNETCDQLARQESKRALSPSPLKKELTLKT